MAYCGNHDIHYSGSPCPRCDAEERHQQLLNATAGGLADTVDAMRASDYRRANPGEYECPHCKYVALKSDATRCPLCRGEIDRDYWKGVRIREQAEAERRKIQAEHQRTVDEAATRERERRAASAQREAEERRQRKIILSIAGTVAGFVVLALLIQWLRQFSGIQICVGVFVLLMVIGLIGRIFE
jgi:RNA polymerase subunit RPABC4/transcription elongation factor Spt4